MLVVQSDRSFISHSLDKIKQISVNHTNLCFISSDLPYSHLNEYSTVCVNRLDWSFWSIALVVFMISQFRQKIYF